MTINVNQIACAHTNSPVSGVDAQLMRIDTWISQEDLFDCDPDLVVLRSEPNFDHPENVQPIPVTYQSTTINSNHQAKPKETLFVELDSTQKTNNQFISIK